MLVDVSTSYIQKEQNGVVSYEKKLEFNEP